MGKLLDLLLDPGFASKGFGALVGAGGNILAQHMQNNAQEDFYVNYMSPEARMADMRAAGINPAAAAQGISGSSAPQMTAAAPTSAFTGIGEQLGESVNSALTAMNLRKQNENLDQEIRGKKIENDEREIELGHKEEVIQADLEEARASAAEKRQNVKNLENQVDKIKQEIENLKEQKNQIIAEVGQIEYENQLMQAEKRAQNAKAALDEATKKYGVAPGTPYFNYYKACYEHGEDSPEAQAELNKVEKSSYSTAHGSEQAGLDVNMGHTGLYGQTVDAVRRFVGTTNDFGIPDILASFGISFDKNGLPHFAPIDKLVGRATRPSYDKWKSQTRSSINKSIDQMTNDFRAGKLSKEDYSSGRKALNAMLKDGLSYESYKKTFGIK